jgi:hypothetical protein
MGRKKCEYALYKGDTILGVGTLDELSQQLHLTVWSLRYLTNPTYFKRMAEKGYTNYKRLYKIEE